MTGRPTVKGPAGSLSHSDHYRGVPTPTHEAVTAVLAEALAALDAEEVPHLLMGGLVVARYARPRTTDDVDVFVRPEHAGRALDALAAAGFEVEEADPMWLYKAHKDGVLVDVIFRSSGEVYLDAGKPIVVEAPQSVAANVFREIGETLLERVKQPTPRTV